MPRQRNGRGMKNDGFGRRASGWAMATVIAVGLVASVLAASTAPPRPAAPASSPAPLAHPVSLPQEGTILPGDLVAVDFTTFLEGEPWKTTYGWVAKLMAGKEAQVNVSEFEPVAVEAGRAYPENPLLDRLAAALPGKAYGQHFVLPIDAAFGADGDLTRIPLARTWGPYDLRTSWDEARFREAFGEPALGRSVAASKLFNATVVAIDAEGVHLETELPASERVAVPFLNAFLAVLRPADGQVAFRIDPITNVSFGISQDRAHFQLPQGQYIVEQVDDERIVYLHHPTWSPVLVGLDFELRVDVHEKLPRASAASQEGGVEP